MPLPPSSLSDIFPGHASVAVPSWLGDAGRLRRGHRCSLARPVDHPTTPQVRDQGRLRFRWDWCKVLHAVCAPPPLQKSWVHNLCFPFHDCVDRSPRCLSPGLLPHVQPRGCLCEGLCRLPVTLPFHAQLGSYRSHDLRPDRGGTCMQLVAPSYSLFLTPSQPDGR